MVTSPRLSALLVFCGFVVTAFSDDRPVCFQGFRRTNNGHITSNTIISTISCKLTEECGLVTIDFTQEDGNPGKMEEAFCIDTAKESERCGGSEHTEDGMTDSECKLTRCKTFACNKPSTPTKCKSLNQKSDVLFFPGCTLKESLDGINKCVAQLFRNFPYSDISTCRDTARASLRCAHDLATKCLSPICPSLVGLLPLEMPKFYQKIIDGLGDLTKFDLTPEKGDAVIDAVCLSPNKDIATKVAAKMKMVADFIRDDGAKMEICSDSYISDLAVGLQEIYSRLVGVSTRDSFCGTVSLFKSLLIDGWTGQCNKTAALQVMSKILPVGYDPVMPELKIALQVLEDFVATYHPPDCAVGGFGSSNPEEPEAAEETVAEQNDEPASQQQAAQSAAVDPAAVNIASGLNQGVPQLVALAQQAGVSKDTVADVVAAAKSADAKSSVADVIKAVVAAAAGNGADVRSFSCVYFTAFFSALIGLLAHRLY